jgi:cystathionine beta-lyase
VNDFLTCNLPRIRLAEPESAYLLWLDFSHQQPVIRGYDNWLAKDGKGFQRLNIACPRATLEKPSPNCKRSRSAVRETVLCPLP